MVYITINYLVIILTRLYAEALVQLTIDLKGILILWIFIILLIAGGVRMRLSYYHFTSLCIIIRLSLIIFLDSF
jgi:hypothetical protein